MRKIVNFFLSIILLLTLIHSATGQINLKIAYNPTYGNFGGINGLLEQYTPDVTQVQTEFGKLKFVHGIQLGVRYRFGRSSMEFGWENLSRSRTAISFNSVSETFDERQYDFSLNSFSFGVDTYFGNIGFGTAILSSNLKVDRAIGSNELNISNEQQWGLRLQLNWVIQESNQVSLVLKPYYQFALSPYGLDSFADDLDVSPTVGIDENARLFGIAFVFYNGKQ